MTFTSLQICGGGAANAARDAREAKHTVMSGHRYVNHSGTVVVGNDRAIELNQIATRMMRA
jgi:hypothetical protein